MSRIDGLWWLLLSMGPLYLFQRSLQKELQILLLFLTRRADVSLVVYSLLFFPGVLLHEISHYIMANLLGVRTGKLSVIPQNLGNGRLRLGYLETDEVDFIRDALIGVAPLFVGMLFVGFVGKMKLGYLEIWDAIVTMNLGTVIEEVNNSITQPNYWVWFYVAVAVSATMMPSPSDRRAWLPLILAFTLLLGSGILLGLGPMLMDSFIPIINNTFKSIALIFNFSMVVQLSVLVPTTLFRRIVGQFRGLAVK